MKKLIGVLGIAVIAMALFFNTNTINGSNKNFDLASLLTINMANAECTSGGSGSTGCTYSAEIFGVSQECSVTCSPGYYSCCYLGTNLEAQCKCVEYS